MYSAQLSEAVARIRHGGIVAYPTEAVYGLGCDPADTTAVKKILRLKQRTAKHGLILIAADFKALAPYCLMPIASVWQRVARTWPGPYTWLLRAADVSPLLTGDTGHIAVRVTAHPVASALCRACGHPLVSTSANVHGRPPARTVTQLHSAFKDAEIDYILPGAVGGRARPTPVLSSGDGRVIRAA